MLLVDELEAARRDAADLAELIDNLEAMGGVTLELVPPVGFAGVPRVRIRRPDPTPLQGADSADALPPDAPSYRTKHGPSPLRSRGDGR